MTADKLLSTLILALRSLALHKLRSSLTILGIIFGVASVITMLAVGEGASQAAQEGIRKLGSTNIIVTSVKKEEPTDDSDTKRAFSTSSYGITYADVSRIESTITERKSLTRQRLYTGEVRFQTQKADAQVICTDASLLDASPLTISAGRSLCEMDLQQQSNVCIIDGALARHLFPYQNPLDHKVSYRNTHYQVVGVTQVPPSSDQFASYQLYLPFTTARANYGELSFQLSGGSYLSENVNVHRLVISLHDVQSVYRAYQQLLRIMAHGHPNVTDYEIQVPIKLLEQAAETKRMFSILLGSIAGISLLVGGIGIMNIMLATVSERTKEIGLRRAIGAQKRDIVIQFMSEATVLSLIGGLAGVLLGILLPLLITATTGIATQVTPFSVLLAFIISGLTGIIFGSYPAIKSANLSPIEALKDI